MTSIATSTTTLATTATNTRATTASHSRARPRTPRADWGARAIVLLIASTTFLFAGSYVSALVVPGVLCLGLALAYRPMTDRRALDAPRAIDWWLCGIAVLIALQLVPLPAGVIDRVSPAARGVWQRLSLAPINGALPISVDLSSSAWALGIYLGALTTFLVCRQVFAAGGVRIVARGIATIGLLLSALCLAQDATAHGLMYWRWKPAFAVAPPFGPFLNRNHFATWVVMAVPPTLGYLLAHAAAHAHDPTPHARPHSRLRELLDARSIWLAAAICLMLVGLVASLSRAGMLAMVAALTLGGYLRSRTTDTPASGWAKAALALAGLAAIVRINPVELYQRFGALGIAASDRIAIWRATLPVVKDFWLTGTGAGTFGTVMLAYQDTPSLFRINAAHNHYLQIAAEGGLSIGVPAAVALALLGQAARQALVGDRSGMHLLRIGALSGLAGAAVQSLWETGLTTPANAVLAAALAAIAVHRSARPVRVAD